MNKQCHPYLKDLEMKYTCYTSLRIQIKEPYNGLFKIRIFLHIFPLMIESKITSRINDYCYYYVGQQYIEQCTLKV